MPACNGGRVSVQCRRAILVLCTVWQTGEVDVFGFTQGTRHGGFGGVHFSKLQLRMYN